MGNSGTLAQEIQTGFIYQRGLLPTPTTQEPTTECNLTENGRRMTNNGEDSHSLNIGRMASMGMLPNPRSSDERMHWRTENWKGSDLGSEINYILGTRSHLNPLFVAEMMGFPTDWTILPFQNGETKASKDMEMP
jgi:hypothetical protein